jgi:hypothetical protein
MPLPQPASRTSFGPGLLTSLLPKTVTRPVPRFVSFASFDVFTLFEEQSLQQYSQLNCGKPSDNPQSASGTRLVNTR